MIEIWERWFPWNGLNQHTWPRKCWTKRFKEINFYVYLYKKSTSSLTSFLRYCKDFADMLCWVFWACLTNTTENGSINLWTSLKSTFLQKIKFIPPFFLEILHSEESYHLISQKYFSQHIENQNFARYGVCGEISVTISFFILDYFQEKLITNFSKTQKKKFFFLAHFGPIFGKLELFWKICFDRFFQFWVGIIAQNFKNNWKVGPEESSLQTEGLTDLKEWMCRTLLASAEVQKELSLWRVS